MIITGITFGKNIQEPLNSRPVRMQGNAPEYHKPIEIKPVFTNLGDKEAAIVTLLRERNSVNYVCSKLSASKEKVLELRRQYGVTWKRKSDKSKKFLRNGKMVYRSQYPTFESKFNGTF